MSPHYRRRARFRDNLAALLQSGFENETVETCVIVDFTREEIATYENKRLIVVRNGTQAIDASEGAANERIITVEVAVLGILSPLKQDAGKTKRDYRQQRKEEADELDALTQEIIELWSPMGQMTELGSEDFAFQSLDSVTLDVDRLYNSNVYLSLIRLSYRDTLDRATP
ncbi:hypothetical protein U8335_26695 [Roseiconus lacunae]|uniref:hypothetical protein n=1 Tax=Roseiconus lacunae TaxID=2605694 RepID=UPI001E457B05|nr:hypothetical protein [Roseiconus lacunae]MCD0459952.1 hypothetical protein [Roseiconus lacunae]WRQ50523.1 hypothetical protein U8335_26695 [Stieleria sp. HD01]